MAHHHLLRRVLLLAPHLLRWLLAVNPLMRKMTQTSTGWIMQYSTPSALAASLPRKLASQSDRARIAKASPSRAPILTRSVNSKPATLLRLAELLTQRSGGTATVSTMVRSHAAYVCMTLGPIIADFTHSSRKVGKKSPMHLGIGVHRLTKSKACTLTTHPN